MLPCYGGKYQKPINTEKGSIHILYIRSFNRFILISLALLGLSVSSVNASSFNIDFGDDYLGLPSSYGAASGQTGTWNDITSLGTTSNLTDVGGAPTTTDIDINAGTISGHWNAPTNNDETLLNDNFFSSSATWSLSINDLAQGAYDIYYYAPAHTSVPTGAFTINGTARQSLNGSTTMSQGVSWDVLFGVAIDATETLTITRVGTSGNAGLSGLQIVSASAVPVPAAIWLFGTALIGLVGFGKRRKAA